MYPARFEYHAPASVDEALEILEHEAVDPVCGMTVAVEVAAERVEHEGSTVVFCSAHCRERFEVEPHRYAGLRAP